jgi:GNAT superfamily N-acetyltransferase
MAFVTRLATTADYPIFVRLFPELHVHDPLPTAEHFQERMLPRVLLLCENDAAIGYTYWQRYGDTAHLVNIVTDPRVRGRGAGRALIDATRDLVARAGCTRWYLNVKRDNTPALRLYHQSGFVIEHETAALRMTWAQVDTLADAGAAEAFVVTPADDDAIAARFALERERLAFWRTRPTARLVALRQGDALVGFAVFDPTFPGAHPFRVARPDLARALLDGCRAYADLGGRDFLHITVEANPPLRAALAAAGAVVTFELVQMGAAITL